jgi:hypothetical protein
MTTILRRFFQASEPIAWALGILLLPLTSVPLLARLTGASTVAPISALPVAWLVLVFFIPYLLRGGRLPRQTLPFFIFIGVAIIASAAAYFLDVPFYRGRNLLGEQIPAFATLALGAAYYLIFATWPHSEGRLRLSLKLINIGGITIIIWSLLQAGVIWGLNGRYPTLMIQIQSWLSLQDFIPGRVSGFTYEPSWLAHQLNILYLPFWLAASIERYSAHRFKFGRVSLENLLLLGGLAVLLLSFSRVGILAFLAVCAFLIVRQALRWASRLSERPRSDGARPARLARIGTQAGMLAVFGLVLVLGFVALIYLMGRVDERLASLFDLENLRGATFYDITNQLAFAERVVYWATGWEVFNDFPLLGVGLGTTGFFFPEKIPAFGWGLWEIQQLFFRLPYLPNLKSMWVRILTETGIIGFAFYSSWYYLLWRSAKTLAFRHTRLLKTIAMAGLLVLIAYLIEGFSIDSFAMPYLWVSMGLLTAAVTSERDSDKTEAEDGG